MSDKNKGKIRKVTHLSAAERAVGAALAGLDQLINPLYRTRVTAEEHMHNLTEFTKDPRIAQRILSEIQNSIVEASTDTIRGLLNTAGFVSPLFEAGNERAAAALEALKPAVGESDEGAELPPTTVAV